MSILCVTVNFNSDSDKWLLARIDWASERALPGTCASNWYNWWYLRTLTGPCHGWFGDFWQELTGCQKQLSPKFVQVAELIGDTRVSSWLTLLWNFIMPLVSRSYEIIHFTLIWDHISNVEQEGSDDLYHTSEYVLQYAPRNLIITKRHLLEYIPQYVLEYVLISYDKYCRMHSGTHRL